MDASNLVVSQITLGAVGAWLLQFLKNRTWFPLLSDESTKVVKVFWSLVTSALAITGLTYTYDSSAHILIIGNFSLTMIANAAWHWLTQFVMQEGWYQAILKPAAPVPVVAAATPSK